MTSHFSHVSSSSCFHSSVFLSAFPILGSDFIAFHLLGFLFILTGGMSVRFLSNSGKFLLYILIVTATVVLPLRMLLALSCVSAGPSPALAPRCNLLQCCKGLCPFSGCWDHCLTETSLGSMSILCRHTSNLNSYLSPTCDVLRHS